MTKRISGIMTIIRELAAEVLGLPDLDVSAVACEP
jgi:hypothetical protein